MDGISKTNNDDEDVRVAVLFPVLNRPAEAAGLVVRVSQRPSDS